MILECGAIVQRPAIIDEVHVAGLEIEFDAHRCVAQHPIERVKRAPLGRRQRLCDLLVSRFNPVAPLWFVEVRASDDVLEDATVLFDRSD
jgi:hypothetical protein